MSVEIKWNDTDPETGQKRWLRAEKYAGAWRFSYRLQRRDVPWLPLTPTRAMWEHVLDSVQRRYRRREGVSDEDVRHVERQLKEWRPPPGEEE
jgi:hypothetical protein